MQQAFSSVRQAVAWALLLAVLLASPGLLAITNCFQRRDVYPAIAWKYGPFPWIEQKIFAETKDVDIAFLGSSQIWCAIDTPYVQKKLSERLGHDAEVFTLGWPWPGFDALYVIARDLLDRRRVHTLVIYDEARSVDDLPHVESSKWFLMGSNSEALRGLPPLSQARLYAGAVLGMPRHLLSLLRPDLMEDPAHARTNFWNTYYRAPSVVERLGSLRARLAYGVSPDFVPFEPPAEVTPADVVVYSDQAPNAFELAGPPTGSYELHFAQRLAELCKEKGTRLVVLHTPSVHERGKTGIPEREPWPHLLAGSVDIVGIAPSRLFRGMSENDVTKLFFEDGHLNQNGQDWFTPLVTPTLLRLYALSADHP
jgi:hypothetical protein